MNTKTPKELKKLSFTPYGLTIDEQPSFRGVRQFIIKMPFIADCSFYKSFKATVNNGKILFDERFVPPDFFLLFDEKPIKEKKIEDYFNNHLEKIMDVLDNLEIKEGFYKGKKVSEVANIQAKQNLEWFLKWLNEKSLKKKKS